MVAAVWWIVPQGGSYNLLHRSGWADIKVLLNGGIPVAIFVVGLFIVWLELDEIRIEKGLRTEEKKKK